jgi:hypothetical protein
MEAKVLQSPAYLALKPSGKQCLHQGEVERGDGVVGHPFPEVSRDIEAPDSPR